MLKWLENLRKIFKIGFRQKSFRGLLLSLRVKTQTYRSIDEHTESTILIL